MIKIFLIALVVACTTVGVDSAASKTLRGLCTVEAPEVREDRKISRYQEGYKTYFWTTDGGMYQIDNNEANIKSVAEAASLSGQPVNMCVSQSTSPYTVKKIELDLDNPKTSHPMTSWDWEDEPFETTL